MNKKTVIVTGAAHGIGEALVEKYISKGYFVGMFDINLEKLENLYNKFGSENCIYSYCDISDKNSLEQAIEKFKKITNSRLNILCANAGIIKQGEFDQFNSDDYSKLVNINALGTTQTILSSLDMLKTTPDSKVLIISSASAIFGIPSFSVYAATKSYLKSLTESLSTEFRKFDIKVASIMPAFVKTNMTKDIDKKHKPELNPEQIAELTYSASLKMKKLHYPIGKNIKSMILMQKLLSANKFQKIVEKTIYKK